MACTGRLSAKTVLVGAGTTGIGYAAAALFLARLDSSFITGQEIVAHGGWTGVGG